MDQRPLPVPAFGRREPHAPSGYQPASVHRSLREICAALARRRIPAAVIGRITAPGSRVLLERNGARRPLKSFARDELTRLPRA